MSKIINNIIHNHTIQNISCLKIQNEQIKNSVYIRGWYRSLEMTWRGMKIFKINLQCEKRGEGPYIQVRLSPFKKNCVIWSIESSLKMMKKYFSYPLKSHFCSLNIYITSSLCLYFHHIFFLPNDSPSKTMKNAFFLI